MTTLTGPLGLSAKEGKMYLSWPADKDENGEVVNYKFAPDAFVKYLNKEARWVWVCHDWCYGRRWIPADLADELQEEMGFKLRGAYRREYSSIQYAYIITDRREADAIMFTLLWRGRVYGFHDLPGYIAKPLAIVAWSHQRLFGGTRWDELREKENG